MFVCHLPAFGQEWQFLFSSKFISELYVATVTGSHHHLQNICEMVWQSVCPTDRFQWEFWVNCYLIWVVYLIACLVQNLQLDVTCGTYLAQSGLWRVVTIV